MARDDAGLEPDALPGTPHPREQRALFGHRIAEQTFLDAVRSGKLHHAWLVGGPEGIGKATFAYRIARFMLDGGAERAGGAGGLDVLPDSRAARQIAALSHPNLAVLRRVPATEKKAATTTIPVDLVRKAIQTFEKTSADGGWRICIVDSAEDLTASSANALLKLVEEPPPRSLFLIVSHAPQRVLPTIRSRCRRLILRPLDEENLLSALAHLGFSTPPGGESRIVALSEGSVRRAIGFLDEDSLALLDRIDDILGRLPHVDAHKVAVVGAVFAKRDTEAEFAMVLDAVLRWAHERLSAAASAGPARLAPLAAVCEKIARAARDADTFNLDRRSLFVTMIHTLAEAVQPAG